MLRLLLLMLAVGCSRHPKCFDEVTVVHTFRCAGSICEVIIQDGAIVQVPRTQASVGNKICLDIQERK